MDFKAIKADKKNAADMGWVHSESWQKAYRGIISDEVVDGFTAESRADVFTEAISSRPEEYYLFTVDDNPAGIALLYKSHEDDMPDHVGEVYALYFHPDYWGTPAPHKGIQFCIKRLKQLGFAEIKIWVLKDNIRARKFYEKNGFTLDGKERKITIDKPLSELRYSKKI